MKTRSDPKAQRNFTAPVSRLMKGGASKSFEQTYNSQIASDEQAQGIVCTNVTQETNDKGQVKPVIEDATKRTRRTHSLLGLFRSGYRVQRVENRSQGPYSPDIERHKTPLNRRHHRNTRIALKTQASTQLH